MKVETVFILNLFHQYADPKEWSQEIGLTPLKVCAKGEKVSAHPRAQISSDSYWVFGIEKRPEKTVEDQVYGVLNHVYNKRKIIKKLVDLLGLEIKCHVYVWIDNLSELSISFNNELIKMMTELEVSFAFTRY